jgi:hypothetical protein
MCRFARQPQGQTFHAYTRWPELACRASRNYWSDNRTRTTGIVYRPTQRYRQLSAGARKSFLPSRSEQDPHPR